MLTLIFLLQILTNAPKAGGSHLPDVTIITPVFDKVRSTSFPTLPLFADSRPRDSQVTKELIFFTASRGHHADVGGILPGSMPPTSTTIFEEGAQVTSFKIVKKGKFDQAGLERHFIEIPGESLYTLRFDSAHPFGLLAASYKGSSGTRCFRDVNSDLQAQIAANTKGIQLIDAMIQEYSLKTTLAYMTHIRNNAELSVRNLLREVAARQSSPEAVLHRIEYMDDGTPIGSLIPPYFVPRKLTLPHHRVNRLDRQRVRSSDFRLYRHWARDVGLVKRAYLDRILCSHLLSSRYGQPGYSSQRWLPRAHNS